MSGANLVISFGMFSIVHQQNGCLGKWKRMEVVYMDEVASIFAAAHQRYQSGVIYHTRQKEHSNYFVLII